MLQPAPAAYRRDDLPGAAALVAAEPDPNQDAGPACVVLIHPAFDKPAVVNVRRPGPKRGVVSLGVVRRRRAQAVRVAQRLAATHDLVQELAPQMAALTPEPHAEHAAIGAALAILDARLRRPGALFDSPQSVRQFLALHLAEREREGFAVLFLDGHQRMIEFEVMFEATLTQASVYPREVVKRALALNAASVILAHNHPSGAPEPSRADEYLTQALQAALALVDVRVLDHCVVGRLSVVSMAERGLM